MLPRWKLELAWKYLRQKFDFAAFLSLEKGNAARLTQEEVWINTMKSIFQERMTYSLKSMSSNMAPAISSQDTLVVRKLPCPSAELRQSLKQVNVGDAIVLKDPLESNKFIVRRLAAVMGDEIVSTNEEDEPFVLGDGQCWVLSDNEHLKPEERKDSRTYGPVPMTDIVGRVIYRIRTTEDHGYVHNNILSMDQDMSIMYAELNSSLKAPLSIKLVENDEERKGSQT